MSVAIYKNGKVVPVAGNADTSLTADNITEILGYTPADSSDVSSLTVNLEDKVDKVKGKGLSTNDLTNELKTTYDDAVELVNKLGADATVEGSVAQRLAAIVANAPEKYDTLKEIATWIESDTDGAAKMQADIATLNANKLNKTDIATWAKASTKPDYTASEINLANGTSVENAIGTINSNKLNGTIYLSGGDANVLQNGLYMLNVWGGAEAWSNLPDYPGGFAILISCINSDWASNIQIYFSGINGKIYQRQYYDGVWHDWLSN